MGWLRLVGSLRLYVSLKNIGLFCRALLQKRPMILRNLLIVGTPYQISGLHMLGLRGNPMIPPSGSRTRHAAPSAVDEVCCSVLQCVAVWYSVVLCVAVCCSVLQCVAVCCRVLQCVAMWCSVVQCGAVCCSVLQCVAVCCSVLQCVAVCCIALPCAVMSPV